MNFRPNRAAAAALAALTLGAALTVTAAPAQAQDYGAAPWERYGSADPCRREAGNRALTWGVLGLLAGATAGGAAAGAGVVAEGAWLGGVVGGVIGAKAGHASAACGTARDPYAYWNHPAYRTANGQAPSPYYADPYAAEGGAYEDDYRDYAYRDGSYYERGYDYSHDSRDYDRRRYDPCCEERRRDGDYGYSRRSYDYDRYEYDRREDSSSWYYEGELPPAHHGHREPRG